MREVLYILALLDDADVDWLVSAGTRRLLAAGEVVIHERRPFDSLYIVLDGMLTVSLAAEAGRVVAHLGPGEVFGEISLLDSRPATATVTATTASQVLAVHKSRLTDKLETDSPFAARFYKALATFLAQRLRRANWQVAPGKTARDPHVEARDEIDPALRDELSLAGQRFGALIDRLKQTVS